MSELSAQESAANRDELGKVAREMLAAGGAGWDRFAAAGWLGLEVAEGLGGSGVTFAEVAVILQELGRAAALTAYVGTAALGVAALNRLDTTEAAGLLRDVAAGELRLAVAVGSGDSGAVPFRLEVSGSGLELHGSAEFVADAKTADRLLVPATAADGVPVMVMVSADRPGLAVTEQPVVDATREFGAVTATAASVAPALVWAFRDDPYLSMRALLNRGALAAACDSLGIAEAMLAATVDYAGVRQQFGRFIGSFQAVKHACADMLVQLTIGRELLAEATSAVVADDPDAWVAVSMAKSFVGGLAVEVAGKAMQLHGGYGYTWESGVHTYLKRAVLDRALFGSPAAHRARLATRYG